MQKDYEQIKQEIKERIKAKEELLQKEVQEEQKRKEVKELLAMERALASNLEKKKVNISNKFIEYFKKHPVETVFHIGAVMMLVQGEWLPFVFCLIFPVFVPGLMRKKDEKAKE